MPIEIACGHCGQSFGVEPEWAGLVVECPFCSVALEVPAEVGAAAVGPPESEILFEEILPPTQLEQKPAKAPASPPDDFSTSFPAVDMKRPGSEPSFEWLAPQSLESNPAESPIFQPLQAPPQAVPEAPSTGRGPDGVRGRKSTSPPRPSPAPPTKPMAKGTDAGGTSGENTEQPKLPRVTEPRTEPDQPMARPPLPATGSNGHSPPAPAAERKKDKAAGPRERNKSPKNAPHGATPGKSSTGKQERWKVKTPNTDPNAVSHTDLLPANADIEVGQTQPMDPEPPVEDLAATVVATPDAGPASVHGQPQVADATLQAEASSRNRAPTAFPTPDFTYPPTLAWLQNPTGNGMDTAIRVVARPGIKTIEYKGQRVVLRDEPEAVQWYGTVSFVVSILTLFGLLIALYFILGQ
jgi:hypothetical protein